MKKRNQIFYYSILCILSFLSCKNEKPVEEKSVPRLDRALASQPPMGWNSWDCLGWEADEEDINANAQYMAKHLKELGYEYIVVDMMWYGDAEASNFEAFAHETISTKPNYTIDDFGRLLPDTTKFPSAKGGKGFKPLADYLHSLGLKFGLHMMRGIPWKATENNRKILGTELLCSTIAQPDSGCVWYDGFYGVDMKKPGAQAYYNSVYKLYGEWGIDFVKVDDITNVPELEGISKAIRLAGHPMVFSAVPDNLPFEKLKENAHMARTGFDFWDVWEMLKKGFGAANGTIKYLDKGFYPDLDMLPIGKIGINISYKGPKPRISNFTKSELHTLLSLWYITKNPLMIGGNLPETDPLTFSLITNKEALEVNRKSINNRQIKFKNAIVIWAADIEKSDDKYLAFFNQWESIEPVITKVSWKQLGLAGSEYKVRDLWANKDLGSFKDGFSAPISAHDAGLYKIYK